MGVTGYSYAGVTGQTYTPELQAQHLLYAGVTGQIYTPELQVNVASAEIARIKVQLTQKFDAGVTGQTYTPELQAQYLLYAGVTGQIYTPELQAWAAKSYAGVTG